jgi:hypothetical protein
VEQGFQIQHFQITGKMQYLFNKIRIAARFMILLLGISQLSIDRIDDATHPGEIRSPYPTLTCLAVEWLIEGDDNENGKVSVSYRIAGDHKWLPAMPLVRVPAGSTRNRTRPTYTWENKHSGSIFNLRPDTEYEIRLSLSDPDGGKAMETVSARTRPVPAEAADSRIIKVNPRTFEKAAMRAEPGDVLLLAPGYYDSFTMPIDGEPGKPIVLKADNAHPVIGSTFNSVNLEHRKDVIIDGLTVWGPSFCAGPKTWQYATATSNPSSVSLPSSNRDARTATSLITPSAIRCPGWPREPVPAVSGADRPILAKVLNLRDRG